MRSKKITINLTMILMLAVFAGACKKLGKERLILENSSSVEQKDAPVTVKREKIEEKFGRPVALSETVLLQNEQGDTIPSQLDDVDDDEKWDELAFVHDFAPNSKDTITMELVDTAEAPEYEPRTNIRFVTLEEPEQEIQEAERLDYKQTGERDDVYQMEGPAWENDKVGFRNYFDPRNTIDVFGKTTDELVLDDAGIRGQDYSEMDDWGMDLLEIGRSLGAGAIGLRIQDSLIRIGPESEGSFTRIIEGPVRSRLRFVFGDLVVYDNTYRVVHDITIWPGTYGYKGEVSVQRAKDVPYNEELIIGLVNKEVDSLTIDEPNDQYVSLITHNDQTVLGEYLGLGLLLEQDNFIASASAPVAAEEATGIVDSYFAMMDLTDQKVTYHMYAGWEKSEQKFSEKDRFVEYVAHQAQKFNTPIEVVK
ncbi:MAG: DUF4861 family protein [Bacteroidota bacterium]